MKNKILLIIIVIIISSIFILTKNNSKNVKDDTTIYQIEFDENTGLYYVRDSTSNEIRGASRNKEELQIYIDNPDYDADPTHVNSKDIRDFVNGVTENVI